YLGAAHPSPLHQEAAFGSFGEAAPVGFVYCAQPPLGEHMQPYGLNHLGREEGREPLCSYFLMLQVPTEQVVCTLGFMNQQVPDVMQERNDDVLLRGVCLACESRSLQGVLQLCDLFIIVRGPSAAEPDKQVIHELFLLTSPLW